MTTEKSTILPLFYKEHYAPKGEIDFSALHTSQANSREVDGVARPYSLEKDNAIGVILLLCFLITSYILSKEKKFLSQRIKDFFYHRERSSIFNTSTISDIRFSIALTVQTSILAGVVFFYFFLKTSPQLIDYSPPQTILLTYIGVCLGYILIKWLMYHFIGWIFFNKTVVRSYLESYFTLIYYLGFLLFLLSLLLIYLNLSTFQCIIFSLFLILSTKILMLYKWFRFFFRQTHGLFFLILYFCALEIVPCLLLYQGLFQINKILLIKL